MSKHPVIMKTSTKNLNFCEKFLKTCDDVNILWYFNNQADFVAQSFFEFYALI